MFNTGYGGFGNTIGNYAATMDTAATTVAFKLICLLIMLYGFVVCFYGYKYLRIVISLGAGIVFGIIGYAVGKGVGDGSSFVALLLFLLFAVGGYFIGFKLYKAMTVLFVAFIAFLLGVILVLAIAENSVVLAVIFGLVLGVVAGVITNKIFRPMIIIATAINGATALANALVAMFMYKGIYAFSYGEITSRFGGMFGGEGSRMGKWAFPLMLLFAVMGAYFQFKSDGRSIIEVIRGIKTGISPALATSEQSQCIRGDTLTDSLSDTSVDASLDAPDASMPSSATLPKFLTFPIKFPDEKNTAIYFISAAAASFLSMFVNGGRIIHILDNLLLSVFLLFLVSILKRIQFQYKEPCVHVSCYGLVLVCSINLISISSFWGFILYGSTILFAVSLWLKITGKYSNPLLFVISGGLMTVDALYVITRGTLPLFQIAVILGNMPFALPIIMPYAKKIADKGNSGASGTTEIKTDAVVKDVHIVNNDESEFTADEEK